MNSFHIKILNKKLISNSKIKRDEFYSNSSLFGADENVQSFVTSYLSTFI